MAIVRPEKPPLIPAQQAPVSRVPAAPVPAGVPITPENMPIPDVMTTAPAQPQAPGTETIIVLPSDPATPQLPRTVVTGPGPDTPTPQIIDGPGGPQTVVDPATQEITTEEVMDTGEAKSADAALYGTALATALGLMVAKQRKPGDIDNSAVIAASNQETLDQALDEGKITIEQYDSVDPKTGQGIDAISEGADGTDTSQRVPKSADTARPTSDSPDSNRPVVADTATPDRPAASADGDIPTGDVVPQAAEIDMRALPPESRVVDVNPMQEGRFIAAGPSGDVPQGAMINTQTKEMVVPTGDGRWIVIPEGYSNEGLRYQTLGVVDDAIKRALRGVR